MTRLHETLIENRAIVQPNHANLLGTAHGGEVMKWMDDVGAMSAMRFAGETCVTAHVNQMNFERPIPVGKTAFVRAYVFDAGRTSVDVRIQTYREDLQTHERELTTESYFVYVAIDEDGEPTPVPELIIDSDRERTLEREAREGQK